MTDQPDYQAMMIRVAKRVGWDHWDEGLPTIACPACEFDFLSRDSLNDMMALAEKGDYHIIQFKRFGKGIEPGKVECCVAFSSRAKMYEKPKCAIKQADTAARALIAALDLATKPKGE